MVNSINGKNGCLKRDNDKCEMSRAFFEGVELNGETTGL